METVIQTVGLTKYYGSQKVIDSLNLNVPKGSVYGFLGRNGSGKSTTIKMLLGLVHPDRGTARVLSEDASDLSPEVRGRIAYMAEGHPLYAWMTIQQIVNFSRPFYSNWNGDHVEKILDHFELDRKKKIKKLSRGQRAQVSLALAIAPDPELLILDDPTLGLDTVVRRDFLESLIHLIQSEGRTILFSSHILGDVERVADHVGILVDGVLRVDCPIDHFKESLRKVVLEFPSDAPEISSFDGLVGKRRVGKTTELVIVGYNGKHRQLLEEFSPRHIEEIELNLEDAFIEYTRGERKAFPLLSRYEE